MASKLQIEANRRNAKLSTGPRTRVGKARASRKALRHGLAQIRARDDVGPLNLAEAISDAFQHQIDGDDALAIARSRLDLLRVRAIRHAMLITLLEFPLELGVKRLKSLDRYERAALAKQKRALRSLKPM